ncbi:hypothetical protein HETIRDRAFT_426177 [Heterobasidion irregulare TC 32-1]|uniref:Uncharacterized protein n=1 Tax=Heterobasidion irregulare (strain TC 32-1) TaxID=747525 RepID=W4K9V9_HETIT|nr:uncharacterized protein HETIRDRAFT_426177 [Heterobasidion irregulare TC 32-1]ETW82539.1 hypothetical protein HETIRDRAFT_426177 [Heterobasidion irregulare TC 32-1]
MSSNETFLLQGLGDDIIRDLIGIACGSIFYAYGDTYSDMILTLNNDAHEHDRRRGLTSKPVLGMLVVTLVMFALSSALWVITLALRVRRTHLELVANSSEALEDRISDANEATKTIKWLVDILFSFEFVLGDIVVIWRAWTLWQGNWKIMLTPIALLVGSVVAAFIFFGCIVSSDFPLDVDEPNLCNNAEIASWAMSMATNAAATILIAYRTWQHRQSIKKILGSTDKVTGAERILWLLVESGLIYFVLWVPQVVGFSPAAYTVPSARLAEDILNDIGNQIVGLYPTMIVVLVNLNRSVWDSTEFSHQVNHSTMCFASTPGHTATVATNNGQRHASIHFETVLHSGSISDPDSEHRDDKPESVDMV